MPSPAEDEMVDEGLVMDCCIGESPLMLEDSLDEAIPGGLDAEDDADDADDNWQLLVVFVQDVCPLVAKVRGGLGGIGSTCNNTQLVYTLQSTHYIIWPKMGTAAFFCFFCFLQNYRVF